MLKPAMFKPFNSDNGTSKQDLPRQTEPMHSGERISRYLQRFQWFNTFMLQKDLEILNKRLNSDLDLYHFWVRRQISIVRADTVYWIRKFNLIKLVARDRLMPIFIIILITQFE